MSSIRFVRLSFAHADAVPLISSADLHLHPGWTALVGENGAGKTTLLRLVAGELAPSAGSIQVEPEGARVVLCGQRVDCGPGREMSTFAVRDDGEARRLRGLLALDAGELARWKTLSPGERKRWQIAAALAAEPEVLLLDEPTNHIDAEARALLASALRRFSGVGLLVTHDRSLLVALATRTLRLHRGQLRPYNGRYREARAAWEAEARATWERREAAQEEERRAAARLAEARRRRDEAERAMSSRSRNPKDHDARSATNKTSRAWAEDRSGRDVARLRAARERAQNKVPAVLTAPELGGSLFLGYERAPRPVLLSLDTAEVRAGPVVLLREVHIHLNRDDRIWLQGPNATGKTTLISALLRRSTLPSERLLVLPQELSPDRGAALIEEIRALTPVVRGRVLSLVAVLGSDPARLLTSSEPSPGEARKLLLALGLGRHSWALILDEPTNHLDLPTIERLEEALVAYPGALLLATHDEAFATRCTTKRWRIASRRVES